MAGIVFSEGSGVNDSIFGKSQAPIRSLIEKKSEAFEQNSALKALFNMSNSKNYGEKIASLTAMNGFQAVGENGAYPLDSMQEGFSKTLEHVTFKNSFLISREMVDDSKLIDMRKQPTNFINAYHRTRENFGAALFGAAIQGMTSMKFAGAKFDTTTADGRPLFDAAHPAKVKGEKQSNVFSDAFSDDALGRLESVMQNYRGDNEEILDVAPNTILIPNDHALKKQVFAAIGADKDPTTANNAFNYQYGRWNVVIWPYLNKFIKKGTCPWVLLDTNYNETYSGAVWYDRVPLEVRSVIDENTDGNIWKGYARFVAGFNDWRFAAVGGIEGAAALA